MMVYLVTDLEGISGVGAYDVQPAASFQEEIRRQRWLDLWAGQVNAAVQGCRDGGADRVLLLDHHGAGDTLPLGTLHADAELIHGYQRPTWLPLLSGHVNAVVMIGLHARAGSGGHLCHTYSRTRLREVLVNGHPVGEIGLVAAIAAEQRVPCALVTGDDVAAAEAQACVPGIRTAVVKRMLSRHSCVSVPHDRACDMIREAVVCGLKAPVWPADWLRERPVHLTVQYTWRSGWRAPARRLLRPGAGLRLSGWRRLRTEDASLRRGWDRFIGLRERG